MSVDFKVEAKIFSEDDIKIQLGILIDCLKKNIKTGENDEGLLDKLLDINSPGLGSLIHTLIRLLEKSLITSFEPLIALINLLFEALEAGVKAINVFIEKGIAIGKSIAELLKDLPLSIIDFIVNKIIEPVFKYINLPFPKIDLIIDILLGKEKISEIDWNKKYKEGKLKVPEKFLKIDSKKIKKILESLNNILSKIIEIILFPIKLAIGIIEGILKKVGECLKNIFDAIKFITEIGKDVKQWIIDFISDILGNILSSILLIFLPSNIKNFDNNKFINHIKDFIINIIKVGDKFNIKEWCEKLPTPFNIIMNIIIGVLNTIGCLIKWFFIKLIPGLLKIILPSQISKKIKNPPIEIISYKYKNKEINVVKDKQIDLNKIFKIGDKIQWKHKDLNATYTSKISELKTYSLYLKNDPTYNSNENKGYNSNGGELINNS